MKKFTFKHLIAAFIVGVLVMVSGQALADTISQIGKKVDSEAAVYVNGSKVSDAIIIKGKSYVPGRDVAEAMGGKVEWKGSENSIMITSEIEKMLADKEERTKQQWEKANLIASIDGSKRTIERIEQSMTLVTKQFENENLHQLNKDYLNQQLNDLEKQLEEEKEKLEQAEKELAELEATK